MIRRLLAWWLERSFEESGRSRRQDCGVKHDARRAFLGELIDDAGLFPPAALSMSAALAARERALADDAFWTVGRFVVPGSRVDELARELDAEPRELAASVVIDAPDPLVALAALAECAQRHAERIAVDALELPLARIDASGDDDKLAALERALSTAPFPERPELYLELSWGEDIVAQVTALHRARARGFDAFAKVRCGGATAAAVPSPEALVHFIWSANRLEVPFKATAGLHHPVRHSDATLGTTIHGFLNVIGGAVLAHARGLDGRMLERLLSDTNPAHFQLGENSFSWLGVGADAPEIGAARARFVRSYGSCSLAEPVADLRGLAMLPAGVA